jgi:hypothetical protein
MQPAYYSAPIVGFLLDSPETVFGHLTRHHGHDIELLQLNAWTGQIKLLQRELRHCGAGWIAFEFAIPRMGKRVDTVLILHGIIFLLEFKVGHSDFAAAALDQVTDYALDLKNFHAGSHHSRIVPIVIATKAAPETNTLAWTFDGVAEPLVCNGASLATLLASIVAETPKQDAIDFSAWATSGYKPTPTIIEAAQALYRGHRVEDITRSNAGAKNLSATTHCLEKIIEDAKAKKLKAICSHAHRSGRNQKSRRQILATGKIRGGIRFGVGPLAHLLRNRFYIGEVTYHGAVHPGEQEPILDRALFDAVQGKLAASATTRQLKLRASPSILAGRIFDDGGNRMTPAHTNKRGARYRYYVSHATMQKRHQEVGSVVRISAPDIETKVVQAVRDHLDNCNADIDRRAESDRELVEKTVRRIIVKSQVIEIHLVGGAENSPDVHDRELTTQHASERSSSIFITLPLTMTVTVATIGVLHSPSRNPTISSGERDALLTAIGKARAWINDLVDGRVASFAEIAKQEGKVERLIRLLAPLAFVSPTILSSIVDGVCPSVGVTEFAKRMPYCWTQQEA